MARPLEVLPWELDSLYILLFDRGWVGTFHWTLYLHTAESNGRMYHAIEHGKWRLMVDDISGVTAIASLLAAIKVADIKPDFADMLDEGLRQVPLSDEPLSGEQFTCRVWVKRALEQIEQMALMEIKSLATLENEVITTGAMSQSRRFRTLQIYPVRSTQTIS